MKLVAVKASDKPEKKFVAVFRKDDGKLKHVHFGSEGMDDYTITHNREQRERYRMRHEKDLRTDDPTRAGFLAYYILWGDSTDIKENIHAYKEKFHL